VLFALFILTQSLALEIFQTGSIFYRFVFEQNSLDNKGIDCRVSHKNTFGLKKLGFSNFIFIFETSAIFFMLFSVTSYNNNRISDRDFVEKNF